jgi:hypothetical protein
MKPLAIDLFCGLGGWTDGLLAEGWDVIGFDIERHEYGDAADRWTIWNWRACWSSSSSWPCC